MRPQYLGGVAHIQARKMYEEMDDPSFWEAVAEQIRPQIKHLGEEGARELVFALWRFRGYLPKDEQPEPASDSD